MAPKAQQVDACQVFAQILLGKGNTSLSAGETDELAKEPFPAMLLAIAVLPSGSRDTRIRSIQSLALVGGRKHAAEMRSLMNSSDTRVRGASLVSIATIVTKDTEHRPAGSIGNVQREFEVELERAISKALQDSDKRLVRCACLAASLLADSRLLPALLGCLSNTSDRVRTAALDAMQATPGSTAWLVHASAYSHWPASGTAARALPRAARAGELPALVSALGLDESTAIGAAKAIGRISSPDAISGLIEAMNQRRDDAVKWAALALAKIDDPAALGALIEALKSGPESKRRGAIVALQETGSLSAVEPILAYISGARPRIDTAVEDVRRASEHYSPSVPEAEIYRAARTWRREIIEGVAAAMEALYALAPDSLERAALLFDTSDLPARLYRGAGRPSDFRPGMMMLEQRGAFARVSPSNAFKKVESARRLDPGSPEYRKAFD